MSTSEEMVRGEGEIQGPNKRIRHVSQWDFFSHYITLFIFFKGLLETDEHSSKGLPCIPCHIKIKP